MPLNQEHCYRALLARDPRYDGRFFVCVHTTGVYCRPICPAPTPKPMNCRFVPTAAAASAAGFRPCLRCKPEYSPDLGLLPGTSPTVNRGLKLIEQGALDEGGVDDLARRLGVGARQLRRLFHQHLGASPITVAQTRRVLLAKQLIHDTDLSMTQIAWASGFGSVRRFNETFRRLYQRSPAQLRRRDQARDTLASRITVMLPYREPYDWQAMLCFLGDRAIPGVEAVSQQKYFRSIVCGASVGMVAVENVTGAASLRATVSIPDIADISQIIGKLRRLFDLGADPGAISQVLVRDRALAPLVHKRPGLRVPGAWDGFEIAVRAILGQQVSVAAATQLAGQLARRCGSTLPSPGIGGGLSHVFPRPDQLTRDQILSLGMPRQRCQAILCLAESVMADPQLLDPKPSLTSAIETLCAIPGIGPWTAQYIAMRVMRETDAFVSTDAALRRILSGDSARLTSDQLLVRAESWRPWRSYAAVHVWMEDSLSATTPNQEKRDAISA